MTSSKPAHLLKIPSHRAVKASIYEFGYSVCNKDSVHVFIAFLKNEPGFIVNGISESTD